MLMSENLTPGNKEQGYLLRRLIRRSVVMCHELQLPTDKLVALVMRRCASRRHRTRTQARSGTPIQIGTVRFDARIVLAPMDGYSDLPFRVLTRRLGSGE